MGQQCGAVGLVGGQAGDAQDRDRAEKLAVVVVDVGSSRNAWAACGNSAAILSVTGRVRMVRISIRPWPRSTVAASTAMCFQGSLSRAAKSLGWLPPTVKT